MGEIPGSERSLLRASLFGALRLVRDGENQALPATENARSLLAYLLYNRSRPQARPALAGVFWPDLPEDQARRELSRALYLVRQALPDCIEADAYTISVKPDARLWVDVQAFQEMLKLAKSARAASDAARGEQEAAFSRAVELYRGDLLEGFYDEWIFLERENLRAAYLQAVETLVELNKTSGRYSQALEYALRLVQADPLAEPAHREVMRLQVILRQPGAALKQLEICRQVMEKELGLELEDETLRLAEEISASLSAGEEGQKSPGLAVYIPPHLDDAKDKEALLSTDLPLVGRAAERSQLLAQMDYAFSGVGCLVLVAGEAGVGKTRLLQEAARDAEWRGLQVLWGFCRENSPEEPYSPLREAIMAGLTPLRLEQLARLDQGWMRILGDLLPPIGASLPDRALVPVLAPAQERDRLIDALRQLLGALAQIKPVVLILENLHWANEDSLDLLARLVPGLQGKRILILGTYRSDEIRSRQAQWEQVSALNQLETCQTIPLKGLDTPAASHLIQRALGLVNPAERFAERLYRETQGNPLFLLEQLRTLISEGLLYRDENGIWSTPLDASTQDYGELSLPAAMEASISCRLSLLDPGSRQLLEMAATLGAGFKFDLLSAVCSVPAEKLLEGLHTLVQRQFLIETPEAYQFGHDKLRQVVYAEIEPDHRLELHRTAARAIEKRSPEQFAALAHHCTQGEMWAEAVSYNLSAGKQAQAVHANQTAWDNFSRALQILESYAPLSPRQNLETAFELHSNRVNLAWMRGDIEQETADIQALLALAKQLEDPAGEAQAYIQHATFLCNAQDRYEEARQAAQAALEIARRHKLPQQEAAALQQLGLAYHRSDDYPAAGQALRAAVEIWERIPGQEVLLAETCIYLAQVYEQTGDIASSEALGQRVIGLVSQEQSPMTLVRAYSLLARTAQRRNALPAAIQHNQSALELTRQIGHKHNEAVLLCNLGVNYWSLGDYEKVIRFTSQGMEIYRQIGNQRGLVLCFDNLSCLYNELGQYAQSGPYLEEGLSLARKIGFASIEASLLANQGKYYQEQGDLEAARRCYQQALETADRVGSAYYSGSAHLGLGMVWREKNEPGPAVQEFEQAWRDFQEAGEDQFANAARSYLAIGQLEAGELEEAVRLSSTAVDQLEAAGSGEFVQDIYLHHAMILRAVGDPAAAQQALQKAHQAVQQRAETLPEAWRRDFLEKVSVNCQILIAWQTSAPRTVIVRLPCASAPSGRPLRDDEWVQVTWTISHPGDQEWRDKVERRQKRLLRLLEEAQLQGAAPTVEHLAQALEVGPATVKRDLAALRQVGYAAQTRGGRSG
ncbi:MAG: tetratricopeptide repeat protein [Anaerolineales bacterium]|nr:tetratricopeptide repeat protein [Anaerolineales bacterium]